MKTMGADDYVIPIMPPSPFPGLPYQLLVVVQRPDNTMHHAHMGLGADVNLPAALADRIGELARLQADNERLQGLIRAVEWSGPSAEADGSCPWCSGDIWSRARGRSRGHKPDCPAFGSATA